VRVGFPSEGGARRDSRISLDQPWSEPMFVDDRKDFVNSSEAQTVRLPWTLLRGAGLASLLSGLTACAGATVSNVSAVQPAGPAPSEILVAVDAAPIVDGTQTRAARQLAPKLQSDLVEGLIRAHVTAEPFVPGSGHPGAAILHVSIVQADSGNLIERFVVGFGAGRARLRANTELENADGASAASLTAFDTYSDSGLKPGLILPGGVALATRDIIHLAIGGGIDIAMNMRGGLTRPIASTASAIVAQLSKFYASEGWYWPGGNET